MCNNHNLTIWKQEFIIPSFVYFSLLLQFYYVFCIKFFVIFDRFFTTLSFSEMFMLWIVIENPIDILLFCFIKYIFQRLFYLWNKCIWRLFMDRFMSNNFGKKRKGKKIIKSKNKRIIESVKQFATFRINLNNNYFSVFSYYLSVFSFVFLFFKHQTALNTAFQEHLLLVKLNAEMLVLAQNWYQTIFFSLLFFILFSLLF